MNNLCYTEFNQKVACHQRRPSIEYGNWSPTCSKIKGQNWQILYFIIRGQKWSILVFLHIWLIGYKTFIFLSEFDISSLFNYRYVSRMCQRIWAFYKRGPNRVIFLKIVQCPILMAFSTIDPWYKNKHGTQPLDFW